jgi:hypothetical protein
VRIGAWAGFFFFSILFCGLTLSAAYWQRASQHQRWGAKKGLGCCGKGSARKRPLEVFVSANLQVFVGLVQGLG